MKLHRRHLRRNRYGRVIIPSAALASFKEARQYGGVDPQHTWKSYNRLWRRKRARSRMARASRKRNWQ